MKMKFGALVVAGRNKIGGHVASANRGGAYLRTKVTPVNPQSVAQGTIRNRFTSISQAWRGLTQDQRNAWIGAVASFAKTDIFGDLRNPSGFNLFQRLNNNIMQLGGTMVDTPPVVADLDVYSALSLTYTSGTPALSLTFTAAAGTDSGYKILATPALSAGISFVKSEYRVIKTGSTLPTSPLNILADYTAIFGSVGAVGTKIFVKIVPVGAVSGVEGTAIAASKVSAA